MSKYELLANASGCRIYKKADLIIIKEQPASWVATARFVLLLLSGIPLIFGVISLVTYFRGNDTVLMLSIVLILVGSLLGFVYWLLNRYYSKIKSLPPADFKTLCSFDLKNRKLLDPSDNILDSLKNTLVKREFQITSSSKKLVVLYSNGVILLAKGNPFAGGITSLENVFRGEGLMA